MTARTSAGPAGRPLTVRVATWSARHRWPVVAAWFVFTIGLFATSIAMGGTRTLSQMGGGTARTESAMADQVSLGNFDAPDVVIKGKDEVAQLSASFGRMRISLRRAMSILDET